MALRVTSYRPLVRCSDEQTTSPAPEACHTIVDRMPAQRPPGAQGKMTFGQPGDPDVQVGLPHRIIERTYYIELALSNLSICCIYHAGETLMADG